MGVTCIVLIFWLHYGYGIEFPWFIWVLLGVEAFKRILTRLFDPDDQ